MKFFQSSQMNKNHTSIPRRRAPYAFSSPNLIIKETAVIGSPADLLPKHHHCQSAQTTDTHECLLTGSTQYIDLYKAQVTSDDDGGLAPSVRIYFTRNERCIDTRAGFGQGIQSVSRRPPQWEDGDGTYLALPHFPERPTQQSLHRPWNSCANSRL